MGAGGLLPMVSPWVGAIGSFMTGSNTSSNILFSVLQYNAAETVELSRTIVVSLQNVGGGLGNMVSVLNVAAICGVVGITGREGDLLEGHRSDGAVRAVRRRVRDAADVRPGPRPVLIVGAYFDLLALLEYATADTSRPCGDRHRYSDGRYREWVK